MTDAIRELKIRAALLQRRIAERQPSALARLQVLPEFRLRPQQLPPEMQVLRRHCLAILARELGFAGWPQLRDVIAGAQNVSDFGTLLYPERCGGHLNLWYSRYDDAVIGRRACDGYLLAYRRQFLVVHSSFIETLGLDPGGSDWQRLGRDWIRPLDMQARTRLYGQLIAQMPREGPP